MISPSRLLTIAAALFCIGVWGLINSRNAVRVLMSIELMLNGVNINLMAFSSYLDGSEIRGQVYAIFVITVAAAEAAVGLVILLSLYRNRDSGYGAFQPAALVASNPWTCSGYG